MNKICEIVQDLLPLYVDGVCSRSAAELVEEHIRDCEACRSVHEKMQSDVSENALRNEKSGVLVRHEKWEFQKFLKSLLAAMGVIYFPFVFVWAYMHKIDLGFISANYWFSLAAYLLVTFPYYLSLIELTFFAFRVFDGKKRALSEKIWNTVSTVAAVLLWTIPYDSDSRLLIALILAGTLAALWLVSALVYKRKPRLCVILAEKSFWCCFAVLALICAGVLAAGNIQWEKKEQVETVTVTVHDYGSEYEGVSLRVEPQQQSEWRLVDSIYVSQISVQWINETSEDLEYDAACRIYRSVGDGKWELFVSGDSSVADLKAYDLAANTSHTRRYRLDSQAFETGRYKFVATVEGKEVWFIFYVMKEMKTYG